jgi:hypothetical protein
VATAAANPLEAIHKIFLDVDKRAERSSSEVLDATFVDSAPLFDLLSTRNHQVVYGRRGTGKTHALKYLQKQVINRGETAIYIDMRSIGSSGAIYGDPTRTVTERAGVLIRDVLGTLLDGLYEIAVAVIDKAPDPRQITIRLDDFASAISEVRIVGVTEAEESRSASTEQAAGGKIKAGLMPAPSFAAEADLSRKDTDTSSSRTKRSGAELLHLNFGRTAASLSGLMGVINCGRVWLLIDEWSEVPIELQPYLADLVRRCLLPEEKITVKIGAIEHRSQFSIRRERGEYVGIELGADVAADLNLDDFMVFENSQGRAVEFFKSLLFKHLMASNDAPKDVANPDALLRQMFTQAPVFEEFVRAVEGVPRDALNLMTKMVTRAWGEKIATQHIRAAAKDWYNQDKSRDIRDDTQLSDLLAHIITEVIGNRKARAFLFAANARDSRIDTLFDARILHILKRGTSSHDEPGVRYDVYKIDYGCYVELINTSKMPEGLYQDEDDGFVEVPKDDHRSIRRAILRLDQLGDVGAEVEPHR